MLQYFPDPELLHASRTQDVDRVATPTAARRRLWPSRCCSRFEAVTRIFVRHATENSKYRHSGRAAASRANQRLARSTASIVSVQVQDSWSFGNLPLGSNTATWRGARSLQLQRTRF
jgi:hypothetical protein